MEEHPLLIVDAVNAVLGPPVAWLLGVFGFHVEGHEVIPNYLVMTMLIVALVTVVCLIMKSRLSVEKRYLPVIFTLGLFILLGNYAGLIPGLMAPTSNINVTVGLAITTWVYYHFQGFKKQGVVAYLKHFAVPPGAPVWMAPLMLVIELISHTSRLLSLSLRLFGNIFGEELVIVILGSIIPFIIPLPMMFLGLITGGLQAFIFVLLSIIYLQAAVAVEHEHDAHGHDAPTGHHAPAAA
jgi:F-type H+-transporting ATPase subunit a